MRILQLAPRFPFPLIDGGAIGIFKPTEAIAQLGHEITFVTFPDTDHEVTNVGLKQLGSFARVELVSKPLPSRNATLLRTMFNGAYPIERRMMPEMYVLLQRLLQESKYDIVHIDACHMGKYGMWIKEKYGLPIVLRQHNFETQIYRRFAATTANPIAKLVASIHAKRMLVEETKIIAGHDRVVAISTEDEAQMAQYVPQANYRIIPAGVDTDYFRPEHPENRGNSVLWVGGMDWEPNRDAVTFFAKDILPLVVEKHPDIVFNIVGSGTQELTAIEAESGGRIRLHGRVPDIRPYLAAASVMVCPLRVGGGMRLKLLDFFAAGKAVVSTHIGAEGNRGINNKHILLVDEPTNFASAIVTLLDDRNFAQLIGRNARMLAEKEYSWQRIARDFVGVYDELLGR